MYSIEHEKQNHPELVVRELNKISDINNSVIRSILKRTGINKWLKNRRLIIQLKEKWKNEIAELQIEYENTPKYQAHKRLILKTKFNTLMDVRQQVRSICHSNRDVDFPTNSLNFGDICNLPKNYPKRPNKLYLKNKGI